MSQRLRTSVEQHGGQDAMVEAARSRGLHVALVTDDENHELYAVSLHPITTLC